MTRLFGPLAMLLFATAALGASCQSVGELLKRDHMDLGVRFESHNLEAVGEFKRALNFWSKILDMQWHEDSKSTCSIDLIDGAPQMFTNDEAIARGVRSSGIVAIDSKRELSEADWYAVAVHELGHLFGLHHNDDVDSVMYYKCGHGDQALDTSDVAALSARHRMRISLNSFQH